MTFLKYLSDRLVVFGRWSLLSGVMVFVIWLTPGSSRVMGNIGYLLVLQFFLLIFLLLFQFYRKKSWYRQFDQEEESTLQRFVYGASDREEKIIAEYINQQVREHHQAMEQLLDNHKEQKDYMDSWIHEIKVPLAAVDLILHAIEFDIEDSKYTLLQNEVQKIDEYVEQVLYYSRLDAFTNDYLIQEYSLKKIIQPVIRSQANYFIQKNLQLHLTETDDKVLTDAKWIGFIFRQLLSNALKYTPDGGEIRVQIEEEANGTALILQDSGIGIPAEDLGRIFDKGFTGENGRKAERHSTGLGLYLAKRLAEKLGVELRATATVGEGTTMTLFFPKLNYYQEIR